MADKALKSPRKSIQSESEASWNISPKGEGVQDRRLIWDASNIGDSVGEIDKRNKVLNHSLENNSEVRFDHEFESLFKYYFIFIIIFKVLKNILDIFYAH